ncbi:hypothetical protein ACU635_50605 [[Actinomadura] parvosata]|uniref:hypothetical protein n=1 Tax=[Actinomadura] parvosata TaxID=1955412 RepID=UPI00406D2540
MDEKAAKRLRAAAEHQRRVAGMAADAVGRAEAKAERARLAYVAAEAALDRARHQASEATGRAEAAERELIAVGLDPGPVASQVVSASAGTATAEGAAHVVD